jgi:hypothetical protein
MAKYQKRALIVEATQWFPDKEVRGVMFQKELSHPTPYVMTIHGQPAFLAEGDWVVTEPDGIHHYPIKDKIFQETYDLVSGQG